MDPPVPFVPGGRDRDGWDCWGLLRVVYVEKFGIELPSYAGAYTDTNDDQELAPLFEVELPGWIEVESPRPGDAVLVAVLGHECHVGIWVEPGRMLHVLEEVGTRVERIGTAIWKQRIRGYFRHRLLS